MYKYRKLRGRIVEKFNTIGEFTNALNVSIQTVSGKLNCKTGFSQEDIELWAELLEIPREEYHTYFFS